jgi:hypothetical protein
MTWLIWRQHRTEALALTVVVAVVAGGLLVLGTPMHDLFPRGVDRCAPPAADQACRTALAQLTRDHGYSTTLLILLNVAPFAIGGVVGAPLLARELESGTWQLAWTQAVPRVRWLTAKLAVLGTLTVVLTAALSAVIGWYRQPLDLLGGFDITGFDLTGVAPMAYALFAFALGVAAGQTLGRSLPAMATAFVVFVGVRVTVAGWIRPRYSAPVDRALPIPPGSGEVVEGTGNSRDLVLDQGLVDASGRRIRDLAAAMVEGRAREGGGDPTVYLNEHGYRKWVLYQPIARFWTFQLIETAIYVVLAAILLAVVVRRVRRRAC